MRFAALLLLLYATGVRADWITEFGVAYKLESLTSQVLWDDCSVVIITDESLPRGAGNTASCGGDNPAFVGWIIAYEWEGRDEIWRFRGGAFHLSHWFDGRGSFNRGDGRELSGTWPAATATFNWSAWLRYRRRN